jgi:hypothetical protein
MDTSLFQVVKDVEQLAQALVRQSKSKKVRMQVAASACGTGLRGWHRARAQEPLHAQVSLPKHRAP